VSTAAHEAARAGLAGRGAYLVGGTVRDALLGRATDDVDLVVAGDVGEAARAVAKAARGTAFPLSEAFGAWRVTGAGQAWQVDLSPLEGTLAEDLARRDFTVNAMAAPLESPDEIVDPHGGRADLGARRLRLVGPRALAEDPLRTLRAARLATELSLDVEPATAASVRAHAAEVTRAAPERIFGELKRIVAARDPVAGIRLTDDLGLLEPVLPELTALKGVEQGVYHHLDVWGHTLAVLAETVALERDPEAVLGAEGAGVAATLAAPLADGLSRGGALRFAALLHDAAKPATRRVFPNGRVGFPGHDADGAELSERVLRRLRSSDRLAVHVGELARHHLRLGFLVHEEPLSRRSIHTYLRATEPVSEDVTLLTVADRLATRGRKAEEAIAKHIALAREMLAAARAFDPGPPLVRGDDLAAAIDLRPGPELGRLLAEIEAARYAGEIATRDDAIAHARAWIER
jgi:poly(A) polymerase